MSEEAERLVQEKLGPPGAMIYGSKSGYRSLYPDNVVVFNANLIVLGIGKVWYGDIDITKSEKSLQALANTLGKRIYILREMDGRFMNEGAPIIERAIFTAIPKDTP